MSAVEADLDPLDPQSIAPCPASEGLSEGAGRGIQRVDRTRGKDHLVRLRKGFLAGQLHGLRLV